MSRPVDPAADAGDPGQRGPRDGRRRRLVLATGALGLVGPGCAVPPRPGAVFAPNANLHVEGIPPIPMTLVQRVARYTDFRGHWFVDWHPLRREMLVAHRPAGQGVVQLHRLREPLGALEQLTHDAEPVGTALFEPREGRFIVFQRGTGGNEATQLHRLDLDTRQVTLLTNPDERHRLVGWLNRSALLIVASVPLDRTAGGGRRERLDTTYWLLDPLQPERSRIIAALPGGGWTGGELTRDDRTLAVTCYLSSTRSEVWLLDLAGGAAPRRVLPAAGEPTRASHQAGGFSPDGRTLWFASDRSGEFVEAMQLEVAAAGVRRLSAHIPWDLQAVELSRDGRHLAARFNIEGRDELRLFDARSGAELPLPQLPDGAVYQASFHAASGELAFGIQSAQGPGQVFTLDAGRGRVERWTRPQAAAGIDMTALREARVVRWRSFDGRAISGLLTMPGPRFAGPRPVIVDIHGGPAVQAQAGFRGRDNYLVDELGIAIIRPNVRGSSGFGKTFLTLDDGVKREDSVRDIGALLDWIATQPALDARRVMVMGGSYGGYMALAVSVMFGERIAGAVSDVGISHFVSFLERTETYRRDQRRTEYGDERDPAMREFLHRISPLTQAHRIVKPLLVTQGRNDPRVPYTEAEQIVQRVRANGTPVWYLRAENEGHGFARKENADFRFYTLVKFVEAVLLE